MDLFWLGQHLESPTQTASICQVSILMCLSKSILSSSYVLFAILLWFFVGVLGFTPSHACSHSCGAPLSSPVYCNSNTPSQASWMSGDAPCIVVADSGGDVWVITRTLLKKVEEASYRLAPACRLHMRHAPNENWKVNTLCLHISPNSREWQQKEATEYFCVASGLSLYWSLHQ